MVLTSSADPSHLATVIMEFPPAFDSVLFSVRREIENQRRARGPGCIANGAPLSSTSSVAAGLPEASQAPVLRISASRFR